MAGAPLPGHVEIPVETWLASLDKKLQDSYPPSSNWRICRVPRKLQSVKKDAYSPQVISIGPFHHKSDNIKPFHLHKLHYATSLLSRTAPATLTACANFIRRFDPTIRAYYAENIDLSVTDFAEILIVDSLFIIELFVRYFNVDLRLQHDPIFTSSWMILTLQRDLLLLENQIPFFVLEMLFMITVKRSAIGPSMPPLPELALVFFKSALNVDDGVRDDEIDVSSTWSCHHLLDLTYKAYFRPSPKLKLIREANWGLERSGRKRKEKEKNKKTKTNKKKKSWDLIQSAKELKTSGVEFTKAKTNAHLFDMGFKDGKFKIPTLRVHDSTDSLLRNMMAYEQFSHGSGQYLSSYVMLMDRLIDTKEDVQILERRGIIDNELGDAENVSRLFNEMCKEIVFKEFYYAGLCEEVNGYCRTRWHRSKAYFKSVYLKNIWTIVSLIIAGWLLLATTIQTVYSVIAYYKQ